MFLTSPRPPSLTFESNLSTDTKIDSNSLRVKISILDLEITLGVKFIILPESWTRGLVKKSLNLTKRYDQTNPTQIHA